MTPFRNIDQLAPGDALALFLAGIRGNAPLADLFFEIRYRSASGMAQRFVSVDRIKEAVSAILRLGAIADTYVGVDPRAERHGGRDAIPASYTLRVDVDSAEAVQRLEQFEPVPHMVIASGSPGCLHAYWTLREPLAHEHLERANRRLAHALGADMRSTDVARIMRPPGTLNFKHDPPRPVELVGLNIPAPTALVAQEIVGDLPEPPPDKSKRRAPAEMPARGNAGDVLLSIPADFYVPILTGREVGCDGKARCPFHGGGDERTPSLHAYRDPERGWFCFGCDAGGTIIDFGRLLYGIDPRGRGYHEIRRRLAADLLPHARERAS